MGAARLDCHRAAHMSPFERSSVPWTGRNACLRKEGNDFTLNVLVGDSDDREHFLLQVEALRWLYDAMRCRAMPCDAVRNWRER